MKQTAIDLLKRRHAEIHSGIYAPGASRMTLTELKGIMVADVQANGRKYLPRVEECFSNLERLIGAEVTADAIGGQLDKYVHARLAETVGPKTDTRGEPIKGKNGEPIKPRTISPGTVNRELGCLKRAFRLAIRKRRLVTMPYIELLAENNTRTRLPSENEVKAVLRELPDDLRAAMRLLSIVPWRVREALDLSWRQVNEQTGRIRQEAVEYKSGRVARVLPYAEHPALAEIIAERRRLTDDWQREHGAIVEHVFWYVGEGPNGRPAALPYSEYSGTWDRACKRAKVADFHVHDLKRYATWALVRAGVDEGKIMKLAGWRTRSMFDRYSIVSDQDLVDGIQKLAHSTRADVAATDGSRAAKA
ncbi:MAG TPA: tyrosine-type recombinase/integrase [Acidobacteriota bacterium]|nr:tyrosine-type recombinase/integrase [Acidobacteriota bacterium]